MTTGSSSSWSAPGGAGAAVADALAQCFVCDGSSLRTVRRYRTNTRQGRQVFGNARIAACERCGLMQLDPRPDAEALAAYYVHDYRGSRLYGSDVADAFAFPRDNLFYLNRGRSIVELLAPRIARPAPAVLDIGTGFGHLLYAFHERFPESSRLAIEFSDVCVKHLESIGVGVIVGPVETVLPGTEEQFDVVTICHVLEHLLRPGAVLRLLRERLAAGGLLYVEVPHISETGILAHPDNAWAPRYDEPHIGFFSKLTLQRLLHDTGYEVIFIETAGPLYRHVSPLRYALPPFRSTVQKLIPRPLFHFLRRLRATRRLRVQEREEAFYSYGGDRIWIRAIAVPRRDPVAEGRSHS